MRHLRLMLLPLAFAAGTALAQAGKSADLQPLPAVPPPPPEIVPFDSALEPQVTIRKRDADTVERIEGGGTGERGRWTLDFRGRR